MHRFGGLANPIRSSLCTAARASFSKTANRTTNNNILTNARSEWTTNYRNKINNGVYGTNNGLSMTTRARFYSTTSGKSDGGARAQTSSAAGALNWRTLLVFTITGAGLLYYFREEKKRVEEARAEEARLAKESTTYGKPKIGGPFKLVDQDGKETTQEDFKGRYMLIYFGFTNCPDICPEELDKMAEVLDAVSVDPAVGDVITPIFITCDPQRDTVEEVREYVKDFHKDLVGLTGSMEEIAKVAKAYRVYFSKPPKLAAGEDYLVDHSIFFYLMDPQGKFVDCYAKDHTAEFVTKSVKEHITKYLAEGGNVEKVLRPRASASV